MKKIPLWVYPLLSSIIILIFIIQFKLLNEEINDNQLNRACQEAGFDKGFFTNNGDMPVCFCGTDIVHVYYENEFWSGDLVIIGNDRKCNSTSRSTEIFWSADGYTAYRQINNSLYLYNTREPFSYKNMTLDKIIKIGE